MKIVDIEAVKASAYNPRKSDPARLDYIELSLRKLGFLIPMYADQNGEMLSGHQRQLVARRMGATRVPVEYVAHMGLEERKKWNIAFNRSTNDLKRSDTCASVTQAIRNMDVYAMAGQFPDIPPDSDEFFPCAKTKLLDVSKLVKQNIGSMDDYTFRVSKSLMRIGVEMPIVVSQSGNVINGIGRLRNAAEKKRKAVAAVVVPDEKEELARVMMNLVSMDFDIHNRYADELRYNSFMRPRNTRSKGYALGNGFYKGVFPNSIGEDFPVLKGEYLKKWKERYGGSIVDFGAGKLLNTLILRKSGLSVTAFEPYFIGAGDNIHKETSIAITEDFLNDVERGKPFDTVFISSVLNSVPFMQDRKHIAVICAALCSKHSKLVCWTQAEGASQTERIKRGNMDGNTVKSTTFMLDYEPSIIIGDISAHPKVQKMHSREEMIEIFKPVFSRIDRLDKVGDFWYLEASHAKPANEAALKEALEFEFELPYPDGTRMGMSGRAKEAFGKRLRLAFR